MNMDDGGRAVHGERPQRERAYPEHSFDQHHHEERHGGAHSAHHAAPSAHGAPGLRERKKLATRQALSAAAIQLALERGFDNLRVEDIAESAGVSPRTFNNYFSSREEAICAARTAQIERIAQELRARPAEESLLEAIGKAMTADVGRHREPVRDVVRLFLVNPTLHAEFLRTAGQTTSPMIEAVAERTGTRPDDLLPQVVTSAALGAMRAAMYKWLSDEESPPYPRLVLEALNQLRALAATPEAAAPVAAPPGTTAPSTTAPKTTAPSTTPSDSAPGDPAADNAVGASASRPDATAPGDVSAVSAASARRAIIGGRAA